MRARAFWKTVTGVSLDLDLVVAVEQLAEADALLRREFRVERFEHSLNVSEPGSDLRIHIDDVLQGKIWAVTDETRRRSKRQKDLADIARLLDAHPELRPHLPPDVLARLV
jgi:hypothetical protein